eukprot:TRINITY_DN283_c0_g1_i1.p1 TRINITY_DN283_c0_g1~~TRINITY_DN283_c0_g1_i1.p1  ORF type:complete len:70 (+),score=3.74 TRINITY_DN283_c0_g1_i1:407-616(+)
MKLENVGLSLVFPKVTFGLSLCFWKIYAPGKRREVQQYDISLYLIDLLKILLPENTSASSYLFNFQGGG